MALEQFLQHHWLSDKEITIFLTLYKLGQSPASTVSQQVGLERTYVYKSLKNLVLRHFVTETIHDNIAHFYIQGDFIRQLLDKQKNELQLRTNQQEQLESELALLGQFRNPKIPKLQFWNSLDGVKQCFQDIFYTIQSHDYLTITLFATNTFDSLSGSHPIKSAYHEFLHKCKNNQITLECYTGDGMQIMETISKQKNIDNLITLPAGNSATNIFIVGKFVYFIVFTWVPIALKLENDEISWAMHFLMSKLRVGE